MGLLGFYMGKVTLVRDKLVGSAVFLKLVRPSSVATSPDLREKPCT